jgi:hypothetical protein
MCDHEVNPEDQVKLFAIFIQTNVTTHSNDAFYKLMDGPESVVHAYVQELGKITGKKYLVYLAPIQHIMPDDVKDIRQASARIHAAKQEVLHASNEVELAKQALNSLGVTDVK